MKSDFKKKEINNISEQLENIIRNNSKEKVFTNSIDKSIQRLCSNINEILELNIQESVKHNKMKQSYNSMLSNISHDIKTPLTVVLGLLEMIDFERKELEKNKDYIDKSYTKTKEISELINKFFKLVKLEAGDDNIPLIKLDLCYECKKGILSFYEAFLEKGVEVKIEIPEEPIYIMGNEEAISRVLNNIISNSIRYGLDGKEVGVKVFSTEKYECVSLWDRGKGIDIKHIENIFERTYTIGDSRNKDFEGSGLGLNITKKLIKMQNAEIVLTSEPYKKTEFILKFPKLTI